MGLGFERGVEMTAQYLERQLNNIRYCCQIGWSLEEALKWALRREQILIGIRESMSLEDELTVFQAYDGEKQ